MLACGPQSWHGPSVLCRTGTVLLLVSVLTACASSEQVIPPDRVDLSTEDGGSTVRSTFSVNTCGEPDRLEVEESTTVVEVRTIIRVQGVDCEDIAIPATDTAALDQPLGERKLVAVE